MNANVSAKKSKATIRGFVTAIEWDDDEAPISMVIQTEEGLEVLVEEGGKGESLFDMEDSEVEVQGIMDRTDPEFPSILVSTVTLLSEPFSDSDEDDEDEYEDFSEDDGEYEDDDEDEDD